MIYKFTRRRLMTITANAVAFTAAVKFSFPSVVMADDAGDDSSIQNTLALLARDLFPHDGLADEVYFDIAGIIISQEKSSTGDYEQIQDGIALLNSNSKSGQWRQLDGPSRLEVLSKIQNDPFFTSIYSRIKGMLYLREEVWNIIGYGGNAIEKGGYLTRGFDDIDWLD